MSDKFLKEIMTEMDEFLNSVTEEALKAELRKANYEEYTGVNPDTLSIGRPTTEYCLSDNYFFSYSIGHESQEHTAYVVCFDCFAIENDIIDAPYLKAA